MSRGDPRRSSSTFDPAGTGAGSCCRSTCAELACELAGAACQRRLVADRDRSRLALVAMEERLRERADDHTRLSLPLPAAVVEPGNVAVAQLVRGGAAVALVAVDEPEPVALVAEAPLDPVHGLDVPPAVARLDVRLGGERAHQRLPGVDLRVDEQLGAAVARDPELRRPLLPAGATAAGEEDEDDERAERAPDHFTAFERTAPGAVARTSPTCLPMQARPALVRKRFPSRDQRRRRGPRALAGVGHRLDDVAVARQPLQLERRRPAGRAERGVVPEHDVAVLQHHLVGADRRRDAVDLEDPAGRACRPGTCRSG